MNTVRLFREVVLMEGTSRAVCNNAQQQSLSFEIVSGFYIGYIGAKQYISLMIDLH